MTPNELRIGNLVMDSISGEWMTIFQLTEKSIGADFIGPPNAERNERFKNGGSFQIIPIPLTPEILEKCGFEKLQLSEWELSEGEEIKNNYRISCGKGEIYIALGMTWNEHGEYLWAGRGDIYSYGIKCNIKYIHQLQNLYFALTGEELEVKL